MHLERGLYIVPTPIGNLADITARAIEVLNAVDAIAVEDSRQSLRLLRHHGIDRPLFAYHDHVDEAASSAIAARIDGGEAIALISDAGTPLVSDPGYRLVRAVQALQLPVIPLPGPCAAITALSASGLPTDRFLFEGFLPAKSGLRCQKLQAVVNFRGTLIFYEAPHRIVDTLKDAVQILGAEREAVLARELTKTFETIARAPLGDMLRWVEADSNQQRGEIVLLVGPCDRSQSSLDDATRTLLLRLGEVLPPRRAAAIVAEFSGLKTRELYDLLLVQRLGDDKS